MFWKKNRKPQSLSGLVHFVWLFFFLHTHQWYQWNRQIYIYIYMKTINSFLLIACTTSSWLNLCQPWIAFLNTLSSREKKKKETKIQHGIYSQWKCFSFRMFCVNCLCVGSILLCVFFVSQWMLNRFWN